jgi:uncharacterized protein
VTAAPGKRCTVVYALRARQLQWTLTLPPAARIADALAAARAVAGAEPAVPWDSAPVGIFGELRERHESFADGDRIELYRSLPADPRERRRARVQRERARRR